MNQKWTSTGLFDALTTEVAAGRADLELAIGAGESDVVQVRLPAFGVLTLQIVVTGEEIRIQSDLCSASAVTNPTNFNEACLRLNTTLSLSNVGLVETVEGDAYVVFGQLSTRSTLGNVIEEIEVLGHNALIAAAELRPFTC